MARKPRKSSTGQPTTPAASPQPMLAEMPRGSMGGPASPATPGMSPGATTTPAGAGPASVPVLVELRVPTGQRMMAHRLAQDAVPILKLEAGYEPVPVAPSPEQAARMDASVEEVVVVRGTVDEDKIDELKARPEVVGVWRDTQVQGFSTTLDARPAARAQESGPAEGHILSLSPAMAPCPFGTCDCTPGTPQGTINDVAKYLGVDQIWA